jgi:hypothetical protein
MPAWLLKLSAFLATGLATVGAAAYVTGHLRSTDAPLHPPVIAAHSGGGLLSLSASVRSSTTQAPLTFTSVS